MLRLRTYQSPLQGRLVRRGVHECVHRVGVARDDLEEPAAAVGVVVDELGGRVAIRVRGVDATRISFLEPEELADLERELSA